MVFDPMMGPPPLSELIPISPGAVKVGKLGLPLEYIGSPPDPLNPRPSVGSGLRGTNLDPGAGNLGGAGQQIKTEDVTTQWNQAQADQGVRDFMAGGVPYGAGLGALSGIGILGAASLIPGTIGTVAGTGASAWGAYDMAKGTTTQSMNTQAFSGQGAGRLATGGNMIQQYGIGGPGVPEPSAGVAKQWSTAVHSNTYGTFRMYYFQMLDGYTLCYNPSTAHWKRYKTKTPKIVLSKNLTLTTAVKAQRKLDRLWRTVAKRTKALKMA